MHQFVPSHVLVYKYH